MFGVTRWGHSLRAVVTIPWGDLWAINLNRVSTLSQASYVKDSMNGMQPDGFPEPLLVKFANSKPKDPWPAAGDASWGGDGGGCGEDWGKG